MVDTTATSAPIEGVPSSANAATSNSDLSQLTDTPKDPSPNRQRRGRPSRIQQPVMTPNSTTTAATTTTASTLSTEDPAYVRRSTRDPSLHLMEKREIKDLLDKITNNHPDTVVLKIKDHILADINSVVMDAIIEALWKNKVCQALYIQNLDKSITDIQMKELISLFKKKLIWCLNIGENYEISNYMWKVFCDELPKTNITHLYASEHVLDIELKNMMRFHIRENRKKHQKHCSMKNLSVIERCTHMWWNPINGVKELKPPPPPPPEPSSEEEEEEEEEVVRKPLRELTPKDAAYWAEGFGKGGEKPWKFKCICGEQCSSYENYRYHPVGRMYECTVCHIWSHVDCVLGPKVTDDDLEEMDDSMCNTCLTKAKRAQRHGGTYVPSYVYTAENLSRGAVKEDEVDGSAAAPATTTSTAAAASSSSASKKKEEVVKAIVINAPSSAIKQISSESEEAWRFKCICGEVCSSYENPLYHPRGRRYACTMCKTQCHVNCMFGNKITDEEIRGMTNILCYTCKAKSRRSRSSADSCDLAVLDVLNKRRRSSTNKVQVTTTAQVGEGSQEVSSNQSESLPTDQLTTSTESTITEEVTASVSEYPPCPEQQPASTEGIQLQAVQVVEDLPVMPEA